MSRTSGGERRPSILYAEGSPARTSAKPEPKKASMGNDPVCGLSLPGSFASFDRDTSSWKTSQRSLFGDWIEYSGTWPRSGMMRSGIVFPLRPSAPLTAAIGYLSWRTPLARDWKGPTGSIPADWLLPDQVQSKSWPTPTASTATLADMEQARYAWNDPNRPSYREAAIRSGHRVQTTCSHGGECRRKLNPQFVEWLMGFPEGWTDPS